MSLLRDAWRLVLIGIGLLVLLAACGGIKLGTLVAETQKPAAGAGANLSMSLHTVPTVRSVTVTPRHAKFGNCSGGNSNANTPSRNKALGFPNGTCWVGQPGETGVLPITVTNTGIAANVKVSGSSAIPSDGGVAWILCNVGQHPHTACTAGHGKSPGLNQYLLRNFGLASLGLRSSGLTGSPACDLNFVQKGRAGCMAGAGQGMSEGIELVGPTSAADNSTHWHVTITWTPVPD
jgi:hypothetical protein